jgi:hypothetical protein
MGAEGKRDRGMAKTTERSGQENNMDTPQLIHRLQLLQRRLCEMANDLGNLTDPEIVAVSEEADRLIIQLQRIQREKAGERRRTGTVSNAISPASQPAEKIGKQGGALFVKHS